MPSFFKNLFRSRLNRPAAHTQRVRPQLETLEDRRLMNADMPGEPGDDLICIDDDVLYIRGTDQQDVITLEYELGDPDDIRATVYSYTGNGFIVQVFELDSDVEEIDCFDRIEIRGFGGNDIIVNMTNLDTFMFGGAGNDSLFSGGGDDAMDGGADNDDYYFSQEYQSVYYNSAYNDDYEGQTQLYYFANLGNDTVVEITGGGRDLLRFDTLEAAVTLDLANANAQPVTVGILGLTLQNAAGQLSEVEDVRGTFDFGDVIKGNALDNNIAGLGGNDTLVGRGGSDRLYGGSDHDILEGQGGDDTLYGEFGDDTYVFNNLEVADLGRDAIREYAGQGRDTLDFSGMVLNQYQMGIKLDLAVGADQDVDSNVLSSFNLVLNLGSSELEDVKATEGHDTVRGNSLDNYIRTYGLDDTLEGRGGNDTLDGGLANDTYCFDNTTVANLGRDTIVEAPNAHTDTLNFSNMTAGVTVYLGSTTPPPVISGVLELRLTSSTGIENVTGSQYNDTIHGNSRDNNILGNNGGDYLYGYSGADTLSGMDGIDRLFGGDQNDTLNGGNQDDYLYGEGGLDTLLGGDGADYLNGDYLNTSISDGCNDLLYGYAMGAYYVSDGDRDTFVHHRRLVQQPNGSITSVDAGWETLAGFNSNEDIREYYYSW